MDGQQLCAQATGGVSTPTPLKPSQEYDQIAVPWILTKGNCHWTVDRSSFQTYQDLSNVVAFAPVMGKVKRRRTQQFEARACGKKVMGVGTVQLLVSTHQGTAVHTIEDVYHIPDMQCNALGEAKLEEQLGPAHRQYLVGETVFTVRRVSLTISPDPNGVNIIRKPGKLALTADYRAASDARMTRYEQHSVQQAAQYASPPQPVYQQRLAVPPVTLAAPLPPQVFQGQFFVPQPACWAPWPQQAFEEQIAVASTVQDVPEPPPVDGEELPVATAVNNGPEPETGATVPDPPPSSDSSWELINFNPVDDWVTGFEGRDFSILFGGAEQRAGNPETQSLDNLFDGF